MTPADEQEIRDLLIRYGASIDRRDWRAFETCFAEALVADYGAFGTWQTRDEFVDHMIQGHARWLTTRHCIDDIVIVAVADGAHARSRIHATLVCRSSVIRSAQGRYEDRLQKISNGWSIIERRFIAEAVVDAPGSAPASPRSVITGDSQ